MPLARSELGDLRFNRVQGHEFVAWLHQRHSGLSASTFKNGRSALSGLLVYAIEKGWAAEEVLSNRPKTFRGVVVGGVGGTRAGRRRVG